MPHGMIVLREPFSHLGLAKLERGCGGLGGGRSGVSETKEHLTILFQTLVLAQGLDLVVHTLIQVLAPSLGRDAVNVCRCNSNGVRWGGLGFGSRPSSMLAEQGSSNDISHSKSQATSRCLQNGEATLGSVRSETSGNQDQRSLQALDRLVPLRTLERLEDVTDGLLN